MNSGGTISKNAVAQTGQRTGERKLYAKLETLARSPYIGRSRDELLPGLRSFPVGDSMIFYLPLTDEIEVVHVLYGRRDIERIFQEEGEEEENMQG